MLFSARPLSGMGAPQPLPPPTRHFPQWSRTAILTIAGPEDDTAEIKKTPPESNGSGFIIGGSDPAARVAHLEHSVRFLQEQHRQMLSGLHTEIEALRERNRDLQFQLIFNKESSPKPTVPANEENENSEEANLKREVSRLEREAAAARSEARAAEARALQLQRMLDAQAEKLRELESRPCATCCSSEAAREAAAEREAALSPGAAETRAELRARLAEAERLVRRLRADADRQRRELQCMKNSLHASLRASGLDAGYGYQNNYHFPPVHSTEFWREPLREDFNMVGRGRCPRRPLPLPELSGQQMHRSTVYANNHTRPRANLYEHKGKKGHVPNGEPADGKSLDDQNVSPAAGTGAGTGIPGTGISGTGIPGTGTGGQTEGRPRPRRHHHRKHAPDHT